jgi:hypothetical protein
MSDNKDLEKNTTKLSSLYKNILLNLGEDVEREGLLKLRNVLRNLFNFLQAEIK